MGNTMDTGASSRNEERLKEIMTELQKLMNVADHSLTGLAKSIDSMQATCKMLLSHQENKSAETDSDVCLKEDNKESKETSPVLAFDLLRCVEESLTDHKFIAVEGVQKLLHFIATTLQTFEISKCKHQVELSLDAYLSAKSPFDSNGIYYDEKFKALRSEIDNLKKINKSLRSRIDILNEKEHDLMEENDILRKQLNDLDNKIKIELEGKQSLPMSEKAILNKEKETHLAGKNNIEPCAGKKTSTANVTLKTHLSGYNRDIDHPKMHSESNSEGKSVEEKYKFEQKINTVTAKGIHNSFSGDHEMIKLKEIAQVQVYRKFTRSYIDKCVTELIRERAKKRSLQLNIIRNSNRQDVNPDIPVLVMCTLEEFSMRSISDVITCAMDGIGATSKVAAVILNINQKKPEAFRSYTLLKGHQPLSSLGGIFDVACDYYRSVLSCVENNDAVDGIIDFIYKR